MVKWLHARTHNPRLRVRFPVWSVKNSSVYAPLMRANKPETRADARYQVGITCMVLTSNKTLRKLTFTHLPTRDADYRQKLPGMNYGKTNHRRPYRYKKTTVCALSTGHPKMETHPFNGVRVPTPEDERSTTCNSLRLPNYDFRGSSTKVRLPRMNYGKDNLPPVPRTRLPSVQRLPAIRRETHT